MATYKLDIIKRHGKFHAAFYGATDPKPDPAESPAQESIGDVWKQVTKTIEDKKLDEENDSIIFRNIAYDDFTMLAREVKMGTY